jgi:YVTN family beta-propeller protein
MKKGDKAYSLVLASTALLLFLIIFSFTGAVSTAQSDASAEYAYVPNEKSNTVSVINTTTNIVISTLPVGNHPDGVAVNLDGTKVYVTNFGNDSSLGRSVSIIDTATDEVKNMLVDSGNGIKPFGVAITSNETLYIASYVTNNVYAINPIAQYCFPIHVGSKPLGVAITPNEKCVYVANSGSNNVSVIDTATNTVIKTIPVGAQPYGVAVNLSGTKVYVTNQESANVSVIDTVTNTVTASIPVEKYPHGVAVTPDEKWVYVANHNKLIGTVSIINTTTNTVIKKIQVGSNPCGVAVTHDGKWVYVTTSGSENDPGSVSVIDTATMNVMPKRVSVGTSPSGLGQFIVSVPGSRVETMTTLASSSNRYQNGEPRTVNVTVSATSQGTEKPSGTVIFTDGTNSIRNGNREVISGQAIFDTSSLSIGSHSIIARYIGNDNFRPSTSSSFTLTVPENTSPGMDSHSDNNAIIISIIHDIVGLLIAFIGLYTAYIGLRAAYIKLRK